MAKINTISKFDNIEVFSVTFDAAAVATIVTAEQAVTVTGVEDGDYCLACIPPASLGVTLGGAFVSDDDEITIQFCNPTAGEVDPASGTYIFVVARAA
jgi:hypothetical protein